MHPHKHTAHAEHQHVHKIWCAELESAALKRPSIRDAACTSYVEYMPVMLTVQHRRLDVAMSSIWQTRLTARLVESETRKRSLQDKRTA